MASSATFHETLGVQMVDIYVGVEETHFRIHKTLLCLKTSYFKAMFTGGFGEATENVGTLPEDDPDAFGLFLGWIYTNSLETGNAETLARTNAHWNLIKLYCLAEKYLIYDLADQAMDLIFKSYKNTRYPSVDTIVFVYENTTASARLRLYLCRSYVRQLATNPPPTAQADSTTLASNAEFSEDFINAQAERGSGRPLNPDAVSICEYHRHEKDGVCHDPKNSTKNSKKRQRASD